MEGSRESTVVKEIKKINSSKKSRKQSRQRSQESKFFKEVKNLQSSKKLKKINSSKKPRKYSRQRSKESKFTTSLKLLQVSQVTTSPSKERKSTVLLLRKKVSKSLQRKKVYRVTSMEGSLPCNFKGRKSAVFKKNNVYCLLST